MNDIIKDCRVDNITPHSHPPYRMKSYGTTEVSVLTTDGSLGDATSENTDHSNHAISRINEGDIEEDFEREIITSKVCSSPTPNLRRTPLPKGNASSRKGSSTGSSKDLTTDVQETSELDVRGFPFTKYVTHKRKDKAKASEDNHGDSSDQ